MAFRRNPIIEEAARCSVCGVEVYDVLSTIVCSVTCAEISGIMTQRLAPLLDWEDEYADR